jgi:hypothetical protein
MPTLQKTAKSPQELVPAAKSMRKAPQKHANAAKHARNQYKMLSQADLTSNEHSHTTEWQRGPHGSCRGSTYPHTIQYDAYN